MYAVVPRVAAVQQRTPITLYFIYKANSLVRDTRPDKVFLVITNFHTSWACHVERVAPPSPVSPAALHTSVTDSLMMT